MRGILALIAVLSVGAGAEAQAAQKSYTQEDSANRGLYVALRVCAACHALGPLGTGQDRRAPPFAAIRLGQDRESLRRTLREISTSGHQAMPPIPLTPREIEDVATYIQSVAPAPDAGARRPAPSLRRS